MGLIIISDRRVLHEAVLLKQDGMMMGSIVEEVNMDPRMDIELHKECEISIIHNELQIIYSFVEGMRIMARMMGFSRCTCLGLLAISTPMWASVVPFSVILKATWLFLLGGKERL